MATSTTRLALRKPDSDPITGDNVDVDLDLNANFDKIDNAAGAFPCTSGTRPSSPYHGQFIRETDTGRVYVRNATNSAWDPVFIGRGDIAMAGAVGAPNAHQRMNLSSGSVLTSYAYALKQTADTNYRFGIAYDGFHEWGHGAAVADTNLYRLGAGVLNSDGRFVSNGMSLLGNTEMISNLAVTTVTNDTKADNTYANMAGTGSVTSLTITKKYSAAISKIRVLMSCSMFSTVSNTGVDLAVRVNSIDVELGTFFFSALNQHHTIVVGDELTTLAAGAWSIQARWKRPSGTGTLTRANNDWLMMSAEEISV